MTQQACPLCDAQATYRTVRGPEGKRFDCPTCIHFFIDAESEEFLADLPEVTRTEHRKRLSRKAQETLKGRLFVIRRPTTEEARTGIEGQTMTLKAEYVDA